MCRRSARSWFPKASSARSPAARSTRGSSISRLRRPQPTRRSEEPDMPLAKRVIPCLDVTAGRVVKGVRFVDLRDAGDPVEIAARYDGEGADEIAFLDITASSDERDVLLHVIEAVASRVFIPLTVGGGVRKVEDVRRLLNAGADKVSINTAAVQSPQLVTDASNIVGAQCIVVAIDAKKNGPSWEVFTHGGRRATGLDAVQWARRMEAAGAGGIL